MPCSLSRSLNSLVSLLALVPLAALGQSRNYNVGAPLSQEEIRSFDFMVGPDGKELPTGRGTAKEGADVYCEAVRGMPRPDWGRRGSPAFGVGQSWQPRSRPFKDTESPPSATTRIRRSRGTISTALCRRRNRDRLPWTKYTRLSRFCSTGTASSRRLTSFTPRVCRRSKCRIGMASFPQ